MKLDEKALAAVIAPELDKSEAVMADPMALRRLKAERIARAVLQALGPGSTGEAEGWRDIKSAPKGKWVLTCRAGEHGINLCVRHDDEWCDQSGRSTVTHHSMATPTHWMPCPKPPSAMLAAAGGRE